MSDVSFIEEPQLQSSVTTKPSLFIKFAYATGIPKNDTQAQQVLLGAVVFALLLIAGILFAGNASKPVPLTPEDPAWPKPLQQKNYDI